MADTGYTIRSDNHFIKRRASPHTSFERLHRQWPDLQTGHGGLKRGQPIRLILHSLVLTIFRSMTIQRMFGRITIWSTVGASTWNSQTLFRDLSKSLLRSSSPLSKTEHRSPRPRVLLPGMVLVRLNENLMHDPPPTRILLPRTTRSKSLRVPLSVPPRPVHHRLLQLNYDTHL